MTKIDRYLFELKCFGINFKNKIKKENSVKENSIHLFKIQMKLIELFESASGVYKKIIFYYLYKISQIYIDFVKNTTFEINSEKLEKSINNRIEEYKTYSIEFFDREIIDFIKNNNLDISEINIPITLKNLKFSEGELKEIGFSSNEEIFNYCKENNYRSLFQFTKRFL